MRQLDIEENAQFARPIVYADEENEQRNSDEESKGVRRLGLQASGLLVPGGHLLRSSTQQVVPTSLSGS